MAKLNQLGWLSETGGTESERRRRHARTLGGTLDETVVFRGSTRGAQTGPYISQFLLVGSTSRTTPPNAGGPVRKAGASFESLRQSGPIGQGPVRPSEGRIQYGTQEISQKTQVHKAGVDHMTRWATWIDVQNGAALGGDAFDDARFITTPRDLATYVHYDQLYQAYLNAAILLLGYQFPFEPGLPEHATDDEARTAFATFGGPHLLALVTEVSSRALKAVRRAKFLRHLRARPEAIGGMISVAASAEHANQLQGATRDKALAMHDALEASGLLAVITDHNKAQNQGADAGQLGWISPDANYLLPMAFPEGSPTHGSYGAGHSTVAGACVTVLKAFFDMYEAQDSWEERRFTELYSNFLKEQGFESESWKQDVLGVSEAHSGLYAGDGDTLRDAESTPVTLQGELDKLAANISIGRDMAGVHYYSDYYESLRLGERVAVGMLLEQMLTYPEPVTMRLTTFDGYRMTIAGDGTGRSKGCTVTLEGSNNDVAPDYAQWQHGAHHRD